MEEKTTAFSPPPKPMWGTSVHRHAPRRPTDVGHVVFEALEMPQTKSGLCHNLPSPQSMKTCSLTHRASEPAAHEGAPRTHFGAHRLRKRLQQHLHPPSRFCETDRKDTPQLREIVTCKRTSLFLDIRQKIINFCHT